MPEWIYLPSIPDWVSPNKPAPEPERRVYIPEHRKNADYWFKFYMGWDLSEFEEEYPKVEDLPSWAIPLAQRVKPKPPKEPEPEEIPAPEPEPAPQPEAEPELPRNRPAYHWPFPTRDTVSVNLGRCASTEPYAPSTRATQTRQTHTLRRYVILLRRGTERTSCSSYNTHANASQERPPPNPN